MLEGPWVEKKNGGVRTAVAMTTALQHAPASKLDCRLQSTQNPKWWHWTGRLYHDEMSQISNERTARKNPEPQIYLPFMSIGRPGKGNYNSKLICFNPGGQSRIVNFTQKQVRHTGRSKSLQGFLDLLETKRTSRRLLWPSKHFLFGFSMPYIFTYTFQTKSID